jgi:hypothetical protein
VHVGTVQAYTYRVDDAAEPQFAAAPDFRYVGLLPSQGFGLGVAASVILAGGGVGAGLLRAFGPLHAAIGACVAATGLALVWRRAAAPAQRAGTTETPFAIVPWGVLVDQAESPRVLRWAAVRSLRVHTAYGRDAAATPSTLWSFVALETDHELFAGRTPGAAPLERLLVHLEAYTREQSHRVALDLEGETGTASGPLEPEFDRVLASAHAILTSPPSSYRLGLETSYRATGATAGRDTIESLRTILRDRREHAFDRRPLAAVLAAELGLRELVADLVRLVQCPHPMVAAAAKAAALRLGAPGARVGHVDEVAPFLPPEDVDSLDAWIVSGRTPIARARTFEVRSA